jgi:hypothetical protein
VSAAAVLLELAAVGITVDAIDGQIRCRHREGALSHELAARVRAQRDEILSLLADPDAFRVAMAIEIFDAEPVDPAGQL